MFERKPNLSLLMLALVLSGCSTLAPTYERPAAPIPATWPTGASYAPQQAAEKTAADIPWRDFIVDPKLRSVIELALSSNRSLRESAATVASARAQYRVQRAALVPTVEAGVSGSKARSLSSSSGNGDSTVQTSSYTANVGLSSFEVDLFGRLRSLSDAALESYFATEEGARATRLSLIAETASAYVTLAADQTRLSVSQETLASAQRSMALTQRRLDGGLASRVDVRQAETVYQQARADIATTTTAIAQDRNALELLVGQALPDTLLPSGLEEGASLLAEVPTGVSSEVLLRRPDVAQAEHTLKSANANIGAARAAFLPSLSLTTAGGLSSAALSSLFTGGAAAVWSIAPALTVPIFDGGANRASLQYSKSQRDLYLSTYELAIQTAFKEVADALAQRGTIQEQLQAQQDLRAAAADSYRLAEVRYQRGIDTFLSALDSQRTLYSAELTLVTSRLTAYDNLITLYRVMGSGAS